VRDVIAVFRTAGAVFLRHWPALLVLSLLGAAVRNGAVYAAIRLSDVWSQLGLLMLVLAPLGYLLAVVAMLSVCRRSLPALQAVDRTTDVAPTERRPLRLLDVAVSVLVPFMAVYSSYGLFEQDLFRFRNTAAAETYLRQTDLIHPEDLDRAARLGLYSIKVALLIVVAAWLVRFLIGRVERSSGIRALAYLGAFVEVYYTAQLAGQAEAFRVKGLPWIKDRRAAHWVQGWYDDVVDLLGPMAGLFKGALHAVEAVLGSLDTVVIVPVGWLTLAAVVLGYKLLESEEAPEDAERKGIVGAVRGELRERWSALVDSIRLLAAGGLAPMLIFSLAFLLLTRVPLLVDEAFRLVVGPRFFGTWVALDPLQVALGFALSLALTTPVLAAAVDWLIRARTAARSPAAPTTPAPV
jgi:hypothetical protein